MELKKELIGSTFHKKGFVVEIRKDNIRLLKALGADVFVDKKADKKVKFEGIKDDDTNK